MAKVDGQEFDPAGNDGFHFFALLYAQIDDRSYSHPRDATETL